MDLRAGEQLLSIGLSLGIENVSQFDIFGNLVDEKGQAWITNLRTIFQFRVRIIYFFILLCYCCINIFLLENRNVFIVSCFCDSF